MSLPAPVFAQPDLEAWVWANIGHLPGVTSFAYAATQLWPGWIVAHFVQADARSVTKQAARDAAEQARQIICSLPDVPWPGGCVSYVQPVEGPFWLPDEDGAPRYCARYEIRVHPRRGAAARLVRADAAPGTVGRKSHHGSRTA